MNPKDKDKDFSINDNGDLIYGVVPSDDSDPILTFDVEELNLIEWDDDWNPQNSLNFGDMDPIMPQGY